MTDIQIMEELLRTRAPKDHAFRRALLWGVTPEIAELDWPERMQLLAVDRSQAMIEGVWPGDLDGRRKAIRGDWLDSDIDTGQFDVVIGDGIFTLLRFPDQYRSMAARTCRLLGKNGIWISRLFIRPPEAETKETVFDDLNNGRIGNFHIFKFRLAMALQTHAVAGVRMGDVYEAWASNGVSAAIPAQSTGWSQDSIDTIEQYRDRDTCLTFPTMHEFDEVMDEFLEPIECRFPSYEMGNRCPIVCHRLRSAGASRGTLR